MQFESFQEFFLVVTAILKTIWFLVQALFIGY